MAAVIGCSPAGSAQDGCDQRSLPGESRVIVVHLNDFDSFGVHVTVPEADPDLDSTMDWLAASESGSFAEHQPITLEDNSCRVA